MLALFVAITANTASAQYSNNNSRDQVISRTDDPTVYTDNGGEYHWQTVEKRVWIPEYQTQGVLGVGRRTVPAHYEMRTERVKVYNNGRQYNENGQYGQNGQQLPGQQGWGTHNPNGMPPGQRKKLERQGNVNNYPNNGNENGSNGKGKNKNKKPKNGKNDDRDDDDRNENRNYPGQNQQ